MRADTRFPLGPSKGGVPRLWRLGSGVLAACLVATIGIGARQQAPDRSKPPATGPAPAFTLPPIQKRVLSNGLPVWLVEMHKVPVVDVTLIIKAGAAADPAGKFGLASLTADMLDEGAGRRSALDLADAVDVLGATLSTAGGVDASSVRLHVPLSKLDDALPLMADVALRPTFAPSELERVRKSRLTALVQARDNPTAIASLAFPRLLYGPAHRYGTGTGGTEASLTPLTVADLRSFYAAYYQPSDAHLLVVGDVSASTALPKLEKAFGAWKNVARPPRASLPAAPQHGPREIDLIDKPGAPQSQVRIGWIGVARSTPDYFVIEVMNTILGGSFTSRLNHNLREVHGYTYGAGSSFDMRLAPGPFTASAGIQTDKTVDALREFFNEFERIRTPVPEDELARERSLLALSFPGSFETTSGMAGRLADLVVYGLPETFFNDYVARIEAVTAADVQRAAQQYIQPDRFAVVVVGDLSKIEKPIRDANLGPVKVLTVEEVLR